MKAELWGLVGGLVAGAVFTFGVFVPFGYQMMTPQKVDEAPAPMIASCEERTQSVREEIAAMKEELAGLAEAYSRSEQMRQTLVGEAIPWPEDAGSASKQESVELLVNSAIRESGEKLEVLSWSCDEYPCVFAIKGRSERYFDRFMSALTARGFVGIERLVRQAKAPRPAKGYVWTVAYWDSAYGSDALRDRVSLRMDGLMQPVMEPRRADDD